MFDEEKYKRQWKNHEAIVSDYGDIKVFDFREPGRNEGHIRFLFDESCCRLYISGDYGELTAVNYNNMVFDKFMRDFANNADYFKSKIECMSRVLYFYDEESARSELRELIEENDYLTASVDYMWESDDEKRMDYILDDILVDFTNETGIGPKGYEALSGFDDYAYEVCSDIGKRETGIIDLYLFAFKLAMERLKEPDICIDCFIPDMVIEASDNSDYSLDIKNGIACLVNPSKEMVCEFMLTNWKKN